MIRRLALLTALALPLLVGARAFAQPMMLDPSKMSGIPRPDPAVPAGTITVRVIRGELSNRVTNFPVELVDGSGAVVKTEKTNEEGRATFGGLGSGPYVARVKEGEVQLASQPIELPPQVGVRVMLVFPKPGAVAADGVAHADKAIPVGTLIVHAQNAAGEPQAGLQVAVGHARQSEGLVRELKGKTDDAGDAKFEGLDAKPTSGYLAEVLGPNGSKFASKPFRLVENAGSRVVIEVQPVSADTSAIKIGPDSHFIVEVGDESVQVAEVWRVQNSSAAAIDVPGGLHIPLPDKAVQAQAAPGSPPSLTVMGHDAIIKGPIAPGDTQFAVFFVLAYHGDSLEIEQSTPVPFAETNVVIQKGPTMRIEGLGEPEERDSRGQTVLLYHAAGTQPNGVVHFTVTGLPHADATWRYLGGAVALAILVGLLGWGFRGNPRHARDLGKQARLEADRERLLDQLASLEPGDKKRHALVDELTRIYKELDQL